MAVRSSEASSAITGPKGFAMSLSIALIGLAWLATGALILAASFNRVVTDSFHIALLMTS